MENRKISWLEQFASDYNDQLTKTASLNKSADQIIVDRSAYPNAKVGSLVDFKNCKYKIIDTEYSDKTGPGILMEKLAESDFGCGDPTEGATISNGEVKATEIEDDKSANCGDFSCKTAAAEDSKELDLPAVEEEIPDTDIPETADSEYPSIIQTPGGVKPAPSKDITGPGQKEVTDAPYHPTYDPGNQYALEIEEDWQTAADQTVNIISQEDAQDRTTVDGHYTWNQNIILDKIVGDVNIETNVKNDTDDTDELAAFDDSAEDIDEDIPEEITDEVVEDTTDVDDTDDLADFDDSADSETDATDDDLTSDDTDADAAADMLIDEADDTEDDIDLDDISDDDLSEEEIPDEDVEEKKSTAALKSANRIISRLAKLI